MWIVQEDGREPVTCATVDDARQYVEDRAVEVWQTGRDPNAPGPQLHPGVEWDYSMEKREWTATMGRVQWKVEERR